MSEVDVPDFYLGRFLIEEVVAFFLGVFADWLVWIDARGREDTYVPAVGRVTGNRERPVVERLALVEQLRQIDIRHRSHALASRAHPARAGEDALLGPGRALFNGDRPDRAHRRNVEGEGVRWADMWFADAAEQDPQHGVGVGYRADRRPGVGAHSLLVDDDRGRQPFQYVHLGPGQRRHESLD